MIKLFQKLKEYREVRKATNEIIEIYTTGTADERQQIENLLWEVGRNKNDMGGAETVIKSLRKTI